jgi:hypothetical protein
MLHGEDLGLVAETPPGFGDADIVAVQGKFLDLVIAK